MPASIQTPVTVPSDIQPSGTRSSDNLSSDEQAPVPLPLVQVQEATGSVRAHDTMPVFTGLLPGSVRLFPPRKGKVTSVVTMSSQGESTIRTPTTTTQVEKGTRPMISENTPKRQARKDGIPIDMMLVKDDDGVGRLKMINKSKDNQIKSKDKQKTKGDTALLNLGTFKSAGDKSSSEDEDLSLALNEMFGVAVNNPNREGNVTPCIH